MGFLNPSFESPKTGARPGEAQGWVFQSATSLFSGAAFAQRWPSNPAPLWSSESFEWATPAAEIAAQPMPAAVFNTDDEGLTPQSRESFEQGYGDWALSLNDVPIASATFGAFAGAGPIESYEWTELVTAFDSGDFTQGTVDDYAGTTDAESFEWQQFYTLGSTDGTYWILLYPWGPEHRPSGDITETFTTDPGGWPLMVTI